MPENRRRWNIFFLAFFWLVIVVDLGLKFYLIDMASTTNAQYEQLIGNSLVLRLYFNTGGIFHLMGDIPMVFYILGGLNLLLLLFLYVTGPFARPLFALGMGAVIGGVCANLIDRTIHGGVISPIILKIWPGVFEHWPPFNLADLGIVLGAMMLLGDYWLRFHQASPPLPEQVPVDN